MCCVVVCVSNVAVIEFRQNVQHFDKRTSLSIVLNLQISELSVKSYKLYLVLHLEELQLFKEGKMQQCLCL